MNSKRKRAGEDERVPAADEAIVDKVREKYGEIADRSTSGCCGPAPSAECCAPAEKTSEQVGYTAEDLGAVPDGANLGLGCGAPVQFLGLRPGETVALHWDWVCDRIDRRQLTNLRRYTRHHLEMANRGLAHPGPAMMLG